MHPPAPMGDEVTMPLRFGIFGLVEDGKGYFKNNLLTVTALSGITAEQFKNDVRLQILAVAKFLSKEAGQLYPGARPAAESFAATEATQTHTYIKLFDGGADGYHSFRIPSIVRTNDNTLLAFVEGRMGANKDYGNINVEYKRSTDNGATWSAMMEIVGAGQVTWGNPTSTSGATEPVQ